MALPLDGFKVLDLTRFLSGPYATMVLADMGAHVTKVERFPEGDDSRRLAPKVNDESVPFAMPNRNKRSLALDMKSDRGRELFLALSEQADVVIENFRPDVTTRLGIDYEAVKAYRPDIIYCSITGFGQTGPYRNRPGFDIIAQGVTGFMRMTGQPGDERPVKVGIAINDIAAGATAAYSILGAQIHRMRTGEGQYIDISLVDAGLAWTIWEAGAYFGSGELPQPNGSRHRRSTPYQSYRTADGYVTIGANNDRLWRRLCEQVLQRPEWLDDPRYVDLTARMDHIDELEKGIEQIVGELIEQAQQESPTIGGIGAVNVDFIVPTLLADAAGFEFDYVSFNDAGELQAALLSDSLDSIMSNPGEIMGLIDSGDMKPLAYSGVETPEALGDIPTFQDAGYDVAISMPRGLILAPDVDPAVQDWWIDTVEQVVETPEWQEYIEQNLLTENIQYGEDFEAFLQETSDTFRDILIEEGAIEG